MPHKPVHLRQEYCQARWEADGLYRATVDANRPKHYALTMLPYPSGNLHIGQMAAGRTMLGKPGMGF